MLVELFQRYFELISDIFWLHLSLKHRYQNRVKTIFASIYYLFVVRVQKCQPEFQNNGSTVFLSEFMHESSL